MIIAGVPFQQQGFGNFGRTAEQKQNVIVLKKALGYLALQTGDRWLVPQEGEIKDYTSALTGDLAVAVVELVNKVLKKIGVTGEVPGLSMILSLVTSTTAVKGAYIGAKSTIDNGIQKVADWLAPPLSKALDYINDARRKLGEWDREISWTDLRAAVKWAIKGGGPPALPSIGMGEEEEAPTTPRFPWRQAPAYQPPGTAPGAKPGLLIYEKPPEIYPKGSFAVHDPSANKWRIFVRTP